MGSFAQKIRKLRGLRTDEICVRVAQQFAIFSERTGWSSQTRLPSDEQLLNLLSRADGDKGFVASPGSFIEHLRTRAEPRFFAGLDARQNTLDQLRLRWPDAEAEILREANRISEGTFRLLGLQNLHLGKQVDWHLEPVSGKRTALFHWSQIDYLDDALAGDKKVTWELNRHQYFLTLGRAYWLTGDERYAEVFVSHINSWMAQNPPKLGINWASSLEVSFRSISWIWAFYFFKDSTTLTSGTILDAIKFLYLHARHLETYLSTYFSPNTHLTGEALGLFYIGMLLPEFREAQRWRALGMQILSDQLSRHVQPDGVYFEQSSYYHRYTTDFYTHLLILLSVNKVQLPTELEDTLQRLLDHLMYIVRPDGTSPLFGDDDGGRLVMLDNRPANDFRAPLSTGAIIFDRPDFKYIAGPVAEETLWLLGADGLQTFDRIKAEAPIKQSVAFNYGGYYVMRDGWLPTSNYMLFRCGPHGVDNCGHSHADALAFELAAQGKPVLIDPGTFNYTGAGEMRNWFRSSPAHNTLTVDGLSSSVPSGPFSWETKAQSELETWIDHNRFDYVKGRHEGYRRLPSPATHTRSVLFIKQDYWLISDRVESGGSHLLDLWFHFDSNTEPRLHGDRDNGYVNANGNATGLRIFCFAKNGAWRTEEGWVSHCYGERSAAPVYVFSTVTGGSADIDTFLIPPSMAKASIVGLRELRATGGRAYEVSGGNSHDIIMIRDVPGTEGGLIVSSQLASDFDLTWVRFSNEAARVPNELVLIGGKMFELQGRRILESASQINYLVARREGDQFRFETEDGMLDLDLETDDFVSEVSNLELPRS